MSEKNPRHLERTKHYFIHADDIKGEPILTVENVKVDSEIAPVVKVAVVTDRFLCTEVKRVKGHIDPVHKHMDHESINYLVSGKIRVVIDDQEFIATPGAYWVQPIGVDHYAEILEDSVNLELKMPPTRTWNLE